MYYSNVKFDYMFYEKIPKGVIRNRKLKKDRQYNGRKEKDKRKNNNTQNTTQKTKDWATRTTLKTGGECVKSDVMIITQ